MYIHPYDGLAHLTVFLITTHRQRGYMIDTFGNGITDPRKMRTCLAKHCWWIQIPECG